MAILDTKHKRKSAIITSILVILLLFVVFNFGMRYLDPPEEYGLAINFGDSNVGFGQPVENVKQKPTKNETIDEIQEEVKETSKEIIEEKIIADETSKEIPVVEKKETKKEPVKEVLKKEEIKKEIVKEIPKKPSKEAQDALNSLLNDISEGKQKGEGYDNKDGVKGSENGDPNSSKYYGNTNSDGGNYNLSGRKALLKPTVQPNCQEEGTVVVQIEVDRNGKVINAKPGYKGSDNTAECLLKAAKEAAEKTTWNPDSNAPIKQIGTIIYKFTLSK